MPRVAIPGFLPTTSGLQFPNRFARGPVARVSMLGMTLPIGDASKGLCGGMVFAARDLFEARQRPPPDTTPPASGTPLFDYLVRRLFASWDLPLGPLKYLLWTLLPTADIAGLTGVASRTSHREWPRIRAEIDGGRPCPLGLVRVRSLNPWAMARNHQVLAYGYDLDDATGHLRILVYDPNHPGENDLALSLHVPPAAQVGPIAFVSGERPVRGFFRTRYRRPRAGITFLPGRSDRASPGADPL
jgi:hypothetical protein